MGPRLQHGKRCVVLVQGMERPVTTGPWQRRRRLVSRHRATVHGGQAPSEPVVVMGKEVVDSRVHPTAGLPVRREEHKVG